MVIKPVLQNKVLYILFVYIFFCALLYADEPELKAQPFTRNTLNILTDQKIFLVFEEFGGTFADTEKSPSNRDDDWLCWAAASANILAWSGWYPARQFDNEDDIFTYFQKCWNDDSSGSGYRSWYWWFKGIDYKDGDDSYLEQDGAGFFPDTPFPEDAWGYERDAIYRGVGKNYLRKRPHKLADLLRDGYGVVLQIVQKKKDGSHHSHIITLWGFSYSDDNPFSGIFVTDSDDSKDTDNPDDLLYFYPLNYTNDLYYMQGYRDRSDWYILAGYGLIKKDLY